MQSLDISGIDFDLIVEPVHILAWGPGRWHVHSEPSGGVDEGEDIGSSDRAFVVSEWPEEFSTFRAFEVVTGSALHPLAVLSEEHTARHAAQEAHYYSSSRP